MTRSLLILPLLLLLLACGQNIAPTDNTDPVDQTDVVDDTDPNLIATAENETFKAQLLSATGLRVGRNVVRYRVTTLSNEVVTDATLTHETTMHMETKSHSSPSVNPGADGVGEIIFTMPSGELGTWDVALTITRPGEQPRTLTFVSVPVADSDARRDLVVGGGEGGGHGGGGGKKKIIVTLNFDAPVKKGLNPFVLTVHQGGMDGFVPQTELDVTFAPEMPTMGHGSPNNVNPVHKANGNYEGVVNLTMKGVWELEFTLGELGKVKYSLEF